jgi:hypothetical protein
VPATFHARQTAAKPLLCFFKAGFDLVKQKELHVARLALVCTMMRATVPAAIRCTMHVVAVTPRYEILQLNLFNLFSSLRDASLHVANS